MISRLFPFLCAVLAMQFGLSPFLLLAQETNRPKYDVISFPSSNSVNELYVAIMGEIEKPGTYHVQPSGLKLHSLVERSGGFTLDASKVIRVIRRGQSSSRKEIYSATNDTALMSGDLLVVDSKLQATNSSRVFNVASEEPVTIRANYEESVSKSGVQIALLNVLDYPVILKLHPEESTPRRIVEWLGQPITLIQHTKVISPELLQRQLPVAGRQDLRLKDGSVLVFEAGHVDRKRLPSNLPMPIESDIAIGARSSLIGIPFDQSNELRDLGQGVFASSGDASESEPQTTQRNSRTPGAPFVPTRENSADERKNDQHAPVFSSRPRIATLPFTGQSRITNSSSGSGSSSDSATNERIPDPDDMKDESSTGSLPTAPSLTASEPMPSQGSTFTSAQFLGIFLICGILAGAALFIRYSLEKTSTNSSFVPPVMNVGPISEVAAVVAIHPVIERPVLERLIKNELPIAIEAFEFPAGINLQGQIVAKPSLRLDSAQSILKQSGPHFPVSDRSDQSSETSLQDVIAGVDGPAGRSIRKPHFIAAQQQKAATLAEKSEMLSDAELGSFKDSPRAPLAKALFQLEKGGRS